MPESPVSGNNPAPGTFDPASSGVDPNSLQEILSMAVGVYVIVDFLIGTQNLVRKEGILVSVGQSWLELYDETTDASIIGDMYSVKFVTFFKPGVRPEPPQPLRHGSTGTPPTTRGSSRY